MGGFRSVHQLLHLNLLFSVLVPVDSLLLVKKNVVHNLVLAHLHLHFVNPMPRLLVNFTTFWFNLAYLSVLRYVPFLQ